MAAIAVTEIAWGHIPTEVVTFDELLARVGRRGYLRACADWRCRMDLIEQWLYGRTAQTARAYRRDASDFLASLGDTPLAEAGAAEIQAFLATRQHTALSSRNRALAAVKSFLAYAHMTGAVPRDAGKFVKTGKTRETLADRILSPEEVKRMIEGEQGPRNRAVLLLLYTAGLRVSELCGLKWTDVNPYGATVTLTVFGKGSKTRYVMIPDAVWVEVRAARLRLVIGEITAGDAPTGLVFNLSARQVNRIVKESAVRAGLSDRVSPHWLRHAHATHAIERGAPIHLVQATLGHASVATTSKYLHARPQDSSARYLGI